MVFENIQIAHGNFTIDRSGSAFYTVDHNASLLIKKNSSGTVIFNFFLDTFTLEVQSLQYDGYYYWTLENQGVVGFRVRKWEIGSDNLVRVVDEFSYISDAINEYDVYSFAVEAYQDTLDNPALNGATTLDIVDGSVITIGDELVIGPSTFGGFVGQISTTTVTNKVGNTITVSPAITASFSANDVIVFSRSFFVFSDVGPAGLAGALYKYRSDTGAPLTVDVENIYHNVRASTFFSNSLLFIKGGEVIWVNPVSQSVTKPQAIDNLDENRGEHHLAFDLAGFSNTLYRLEQQHVSFNVGSGDYETEDWSPSFNYNTSGIVPEVYFVALKAEPPIVHSFFSGIPAGEGTSRVFVQVLDQFRTPVFNIVVNFSTDKGSLSSPQETTDANGIAEVTYTSDSTLGAATITATVP